jgi:hypothetical protein
MNKKFIVLVVIFFAVMSVVGTASAKSGGGGKGGGQGSGGGSGSGGGQGSGGGHGLGDAQGGGTDGVKDSGRDKSKGAEKGQASAKSEEPTMGELVSAVEKAKRDQWRITRDQLKEWGYHGSVSDFVTAFNRQINAQKAEIREKILSGDEDLAKEVEQETAERELARIRTEIIANLSITDEDVAGSLMGLLETEGSADGPLDLATALQNEIDFMDPSFKKSVYYIATHGPEDQKRALAVQLSGILAGGG